MKKTIRIITVALLCASFSLSAMEPFVLREMLRVKKSKTCWNLCEWTQNKYQSFLNYMLFDAAYALSSSRIRWWIAKGANVNAKRLHESRECTPLAVTATCNRIYGGCFGQREAAMALLVEQGGRDYKVANEGRRELKHPALENAIGNGYVALVEQLIEREAIDLPIDPSYLVRALWRGGCQEGRTIVDMLLDNVENPNGVSVGGVTSLHLAAYNTPDLIPLFLKHGADVNAQNNTKETPLHKAACFLTSEAIRLLLFNGAQLPVQSKFGSTPFHEIEFHDCKEGSKEIFVAVQSVNGYLEKEWMEERLFALFCYFKRLKIDVPKDMRNMLADYLLCAEVDNRVAQHINMLQKALVLKDNEGRTAHCRAKRKEGWSWGLPSESVAWFDPDKEKIKEQFGPEIRERYERVLKGLPQVESID